VLGRFSFGGRVVMITGGGRGLGLVLARRFAAEGARLVLVGRDEEELRRAQDELRKCGVAVRTIVADVTVADAAERAMAETMQAFGRLDVLVNNAGIIVVGPLESMTEEDYTRAMGTHFWGPLRFMRAALPHLARTRGRIVNICSVGGKIAVPHLATYSASKFALAGLSDAFRAEVASLGVKVTTVFPGLMRTGSHIRAQFKGRQSREYAWFALGSATPLSSMSATRAGRKIVKACRRGTPQLVLSLQARGAVLASSLFPNAFARAMRWMARALPSGTGNGETRPGWLARNSFPPAAVMELAERASLANNEAPPSPPLR
jgi:short-subunit dehydrogenase